MDTLANEGCFNNVNIKQLFLKDKVFRKSVMVDLKRRKQDLGCLLMQVD